MTNIDIGNNWFIGDSSLGDTREQLTNASINTIHVDKITGRISRKGTNAWDTIVESTKPSALQFQVTRQVPLTNIGTSYIDIFGSFYQGYPQVIDLRGYTKVGFLALWNKNSGTGIHDLRVVTVEATPRVLFDTESVRTVNDWPQDGLPSGPIDSYNIQIPSGLVNYTGKVKIQAKSTVATDDPIFDACNFYVIR